MFPNISQQVRLPRLAVTDAPARRFEPELLDPVHLKGAVVAADSPDKPEGPPARFPSPFAHTRAVPRTVPTPQGQFQQGGCLQRNSVVEPGPASFLPSSWCPWLPPRGGLGTSCGMQDNLLTIKPSCRPARHRYRHKARHLPLRGKLPYLPTSQSDSRPARRPRRHKARRQSLWQKLPYLPTSKPDSRLTRHRRHRTGSQPLRRKLPCLRVREGAIPPRPLRRLHHSPSYACTESPTAIPRKELLPVSA